MTLEPWDAVVTGALVETRGPLWHDGGNSRAQVAQGNREEDGISQRYMHRRRLRGSARAHAPMIEKLPCIYHFLPPFDPPNILVCPPNIFDKSTPVDTYK